MILKGKIIRNIREQSSKEPSNILAKTEFGSVYNDLENVSFIDRDEVNTDGFRAIPKSVLEKGLSKNAIAVYITLCCRADFVEDKPFQISQANIGKLTGLTTPTTAKALAELEDHDLISKTKHIMPTQKGARHFYTYQVSFVRKPTIDLSENKGTIIYFYTSIVENGIWAKLSGKAKMLYLTARAGSKLDLETYNEVERYKVEEYYSKWAAEIEAGDKLRPMIEEYEERDFDEYVKGRKWDICRLSLSELCRQACIPRPNAHRIIEELFQFGLMEYTGAATLPYLRPFRYLKQPSSMVE